jgi:hypothetical protein
MGHSKVGLRVESKVEGEERCKQDKQMVCPHVSVHELSTDVEHNVQDMSQLTKRKQNPLLPK